MPRFCAALAMKKRFVAAILIVMLFLGGVASASAASVQAMVVGGWLRLRAEPSLQAETICSYRSGTIVTVLGQGGGWAQVITPDHRTGYMCSLYLDFNIQPVSPRTRRVWTDVNRIAHIISENGRGVRLRSAPEINKTNVLGLYPVGRTVLILKQSNDDWSYIRIDRKYGYMMSSFLTGGSEDEMQPVGTPQYQSVSPLKKIHLSSQTPQVGDMLSLTLQPAGATCTYLWYRDDNRKLSTESYYIVQPGDAGHVIRVRVTGTGISAGIHLDAVTGVVLAGSDPEEEDWSDPTYFPTEYPYGFNIPLS